MPLESRSFTVSDMAFLALNSVAYFAVGFAIFKHMEHLARRRGLLGHY